jgi:hypothetical protein
MTTGSYRTMPPVATVSGVIEDPENLPRSFDDRRRLVADDGPREQR